MLAVRLPEGLENRLNDLAKKTHRSKSYYIRTAIEQFVEDTEDYLLAVEILAENNPRIPYEEIRKRYELED